MQDHTTEKSPVKLCECGCGQPAPIAKRNNSIYGHIKGQPVRFVSGHYISPTRPLEERFRARVDRSNLDDCWEWTATKRWGYGILSVKDGVGRLAHRYSYELHYGPSPDELCVLHRCDNPACVRPDHLFLGTHADNVKDKVSKQRQPRGENHWRTKFTEEDIVEIRRKYREGVASQSAMAAQYGVDPSTISDIVRRKLWGHIP